MTADVAKRFLEWWGPRARASQAAHYQRASRLKKYQFWLTVVVVVLTTFTGSVLFATLNNQRYKWILAVISLTAALVSALDRLLGFAEEAERNRAAGAEWGVIVNKTERHWIGLPDEVPTDAELDALVEQMNDVTKKSPYLPQRVFDRFCLAETYLWGHSPCPEDGG